MERRTEMGYRDESELVAYFGALVGMSTSEAEKVVKHFNARPLRQLDAYAVLDAEQTKRIFNRGGTVNKVDRELLDRMEQRKFEAELARKEALIEAYGQDVYEDGAVLIFEKGFPGSRTNYTYVALKANGSWWLTGATHGGEHGRTWMELIVWLVSDVSVEKDNVEYYQSQRYPTK